MSSLLHKYPACELIVGDKILRSICVRRTIVFCKFLSIPRDQVVTPKGFGVSDGMESVGVCMTCCIIEARYASNTRTE